ncbi:EAL domain-containing protein [Paenibacillus kobensis]|uniref:EAL domain-containing protein n=1 Tax=Paenibacillus kobensis TaxID=59841 RepID=UPI000FD9F7D4|nr:EAL domain-containing protein [Paenibacillus kobensis]
MSNALRSFDYEELFHHFQPIVDGQSGKVYGYEALIRCKAGIGPYELFQTARLNGELFQLDTISFQSAIESFFGEEGPSHEQLLFVNLLPSTLGNPLFSSFLSRMEERYVQYFGRLVVEMNESAEEMHLWDTPEFASGTGLLRECGIRIALDDTGEGVSSLRKFVELEPDIVKLDRYFAQGLSESGQKQRVVNLMAELCKEDSMLILEGIETETDWVTARQLGVKLGQGFWLGRPALLPCGC